MTIKVNRQPGEVDILWDNVTVTGNDYHEVQNEVVRLMEESGNAVFDNPVFSRPINQWVSNGQVLRPH